MGLFSFWVFDVSQELVAHGGQQWVGHESSRSQIAEASQRNNMTLVPLLIVGHGLVPHRAGTGEAGNEQHGSPLAHHAHRKGGMQGRIIGPDSGGDAGRGGRNRSYGRTGSAQQE